MSELPTPGGVHGKGQWRQAIPCIGEYSSLLCGKPTAEDGGISAEVSKARIDRVEERGIEKIPWYGPGQRLGHAKHDIPSEIHRDCGQFEANCKPDRGKKERNEGKRGRNTTVFLRFEVCSSLEPEHSDFSLLSRHCR